MMKIRFRIVFLSVLIAHLILFSCHHEKKEKSVYDESASGSIYVAFPEQMKSTMDQMIQEFNEEYPLIKVHQNVLKGVDNIRIIANKKDSFDVLVYDDYKLIEAFLIPDITTWTIKFARDEMVIAYNDRSAYQDEFTEDKWFKILLKADVSFGRLDPLNKTCGYRTLSVFNLAEIYYNNTDLKKELIQKNNDLVFKNSDDLISALENGKIDYAILFKSMAESEDLKYFRIPRIMNLNYPNLFSYYSKTSVQILDKDSIKPYPMQGAPVIYSLSINNNSHNMNNSLIFSEYFLSKNKGLEVLYNSGLTPMVPSQSFYYKILPESLKKFNIE